MKDVGKLVVAECANKGGTRCAPSRPWRMATAGWALIVPPWPESKSFGRLPVGSSHHFATHLRSRPKKIIAKKSFTKGASQCGRSWRSRLR